jgi:Protein of unknown function (DUF3027)
MGKSEMSDTLGEMRGIPCTAARVRYYLNVVLGFGQAVEEVGPHGTERGWTWEVMSWDGIWRVTKGKQTLFGSQSDETVIEARLPSLVGLTIERIDHESFPGDIRLFFNDGTVLEILGLSTDGDSAWSIKGPNGWFPAGQRAALTEEEEHLFTHSEGCFKRWRERVPMGNEARRCKECAYYRHLHGAFYFWDFGLCTNAHSEYDGKVVNVGSVCDFFSPSLPAVTSQVEKK